MFVVGGTLSGIGAAILALLVVPEIDRSTYSIFGYLLKELIIWVGGVSVIVGIAVICAGVIRKMIQGVVWSAAKAIELSDWLQFNAMPASDSDLGLIHKMAFEFFEGDVSTLDRMLEWQRHNARVFWVIRRQGQNDNRINGYFCVVPLKKEAAKLIQKEKIKGSELITEYITSGKNNAKPYALYVGAVAANGLFSRAAALNHLHQFLQHMKERKVVNVYTRPVTKDGLRICKKRKFMPVDTKAGDGLSRVHHLNLNEA